MGARLRSQLHMGRPGLARGGTARTGKGWDGRDSQGVGRPRPILTKGGMGRTRGVQVGDGNQLRRGVEQWKATRGRRIPSSCSCNARGGEWHRARARGRRRRLTVQGGGGGGISRWLASRLPARSWSPLAQWPGICVCVFTWVRAGYLHVKRAV